MKAEANTKILTVAEDFIHPQNKQANGSGGTTSDIQTGPEPWSVRDYTTVLVSKPTRAGRAGSRHENGESSASKKLRIDSRSRGRSRKPESSQIRSATTINDSHRYWAGSGTLAARNPLWIRDQVGVNLLDQNHFTSLRCSGITTLLF